MAPTEAEGGATSASDDPYERLAEIAEAELALCEQGETERLGAHEAQTAAIVAALPDRPPATARPALERALTARDRLTRQLTAELAETRSELQRLRSGRDAARSYRATASARALPA